MKSIKIPESYNEQRVDKVCFKLLSQAPKSFVFKMFRKKNIVLNDSKINGSELCHTGDELKLYLSDETIEKFSQILIDKPLAETYLTKGRKSKTLINERIIYEDDQMLVYNKENGTLSQPNGKNPNLVHMFEATMADRGIIYDGLDTFGVCNRLDRNTTGISIIAKTTQASRWINGCIKNDGSKKIYYAIVFGHLDESYHLTGYQQKNASRNKVSMGDELEGDYIETIIEPMTYNTNLDVSLVKVQIKTGKTHQIRHHLSELGYPIVGDGKYGKKEYLKKATLNKIKKIMDKHEMCLHAYSYEFIKLPDEYKQYLGKAFIAKIPDHMKNLMKSGE